MIYRFAATIQIVIVLSFLIYVSNCPINSLYVILLALFNDITMLPIAYDVQQASKVPETPDVTRILLLSFVLGVLETILSLFFAYGIAYSELFSTDSGDLDVSTCSGELQSIIWLQMTIAAELLIFTARAPGYIMRSIRPSTALMLSVIGGCHFFVFTCRMIGFTTA